MVQAAKQRVEKQEIQNSTNLQKKFTKEKVSSFKNMIGVAV